MGRIIDVRVWDKKKKEYWYNVLTDMGENQLYSDYDEEVSMWFIGLLMEKGHSHKGRFVFEQYVGNYRGKKVYENDIVSLDFGGEKIIGVVRWNDERKRFSVFYKRNEYVGYEDEYKLYKNDKIKIVGNANIKTIVGIKEEARK